MAYQQQQGGKVQPPPLTLLHDDVNDLKPLDTGSASLVGEEPFVYAFEKDVAEVDTTSLSSTPQLSDVGLTQSVRSTPLVKAASPLMNPPAVLSLNRGDKASHLFYREPLQQAQLPRAHLAALLQCMANDVSQYSQLRWFASQEDAVCAMTVRQHQQSQPAGVGFERIPLAERILSEMARDQSFVCFNQDGPQVAEKIASELNQSAIMKVRALKMTQEALEKLGKYKEGEELKSREDVFLKCRRLALNKNAMKVFGRSSNDPKILHFDQEITVPGEVCRTSLNDAFRYTIAALKMNDERAAKQVVWSCVALKPNQLREALESTKVFKVIEPTNSSLLIPNNNNATVNFPSSLLHQLGKLIESQIIHFLRQILFLRQKRIGLRDCLELL